MIFISNVLSSPEVQRKEYYDYATYIFREKGVNNPRYSIVRGGTDIDDREYTFKEIKAIARSGERVTIVSQVRALYVTMTNISIAHRQILGPAIPV